MSIKYARVSGGKITPVRYSAKQLKFGGTLQAVLDFGDMVIPLLAPTPDLSDGLGLPEYRDPTAFELESAITTIADLDSELFTYSVGIDVPSLDENGDIEHQFLPDSIREWMGIWDPVTNTPHLEDGVGEVGNVWEVDGKYENDVEIDLGSGPMFVRGNMQVEYRDDNTWHCVGYNQLSSKERSLLDSAMVTMTYHDYDGKVGNQHGPYGIVTFPSTLEVLKGGYLAAQVLPTNTTRTEVHMVEDGGLSTMSFDTLTGTLVVDAAIELPGIYTLKFIVGGPTGRSKPLDVLVEVKDYTLEASGTPVAVKSGDTHLEPVTSPQDANPTLHVVDKGDLWDVKVAEDGVNLEVDTFCVDAGDYTVKVKAQDEKGESEVLDIPVNVSLKDGQIAPIWDKPTVDSNTAPVYDDTNRPIARSDYIGLDSMPLDSTI